MTVQVARRAAQAVVPWKNGGGTTREVWVDPPGAGTAGFRWRLSQATVAADGPFSRFPGVDRTLVVLAGACALEVDGREVALAADGASVACFPGEAATAARVRAGPVEDLNVMVDRAQLRARVDDRALAADATWGWAPGGAVVALVYGVRGACEVRAGGGEGAASAGPWTLEPGDALRADGPDARGPWALRAAGGDARVVLVALAPAP